MTPSFEIPCVILCGGKSRRMGEDKSLLPFDSSTSLTQYQYDRLKPYFKNIYLSSKNDKFDFLDKSSNCLILDKGEIYSPIIALQTILQTLKDEKVFIITVDTPLVSIESILSLINESNNFDICVAQTLRTHNLCGVFSKNNLSTINKMLEEDIHKVGYLLKNNNTKYLNFDNDDEFINLNNKDEYNKAIDIINNTK
ncbi:molybdenum cofactor guanylyltransferase MobA [Poseidonibacter sp.]|uniref:molybdenum cofactor guanylyltransferase MobA n=1 Tax=Poseidonibacter sp. TaxID=2321188 RepID=UPI003C73ED16